MLRRFAAAAVSLLFLTASGVSLDAQNWDLLYEPGATSSDIVVPIFDGWTANPDGTFSLSFGYVNLNADGIVEIPLGADNFIEPGDFDGMQPTSFPAVAYGGITGKRERNVFAITVPAEFRNRDVVWTLRSRGRTFSVPGRVTAPAYQLSLTPQSGGSLRPLVTFDPADPGGVGPVGVVAGKRLTTHVGEPLTLSVLGRDRGERQPVPLDMTWFKHQGPGTVLFTPADGRMEDGEGEEFSMGTTVATFAQPGDYVLRVRVSNFTARDSGLSQLCCWTNGYVAVSVAP